MQNREEDLVRIWKSLENVLNVLIRNNWGTTSVGGKYGEFYVAYQLLKYMPQLGNERENKNADVYLKSIGKRVEVKWGRLNEDEFWGIWWGWGFGLGTQINGDKFDFCVLLASGKNGKPKHCFIMSLGEMKKLQPRYGGMPYNIKSYYLDFYEDYERACSKKTYVPDPLEKELNQQPEKYDHQWTKIQ